MKQKRMVKFFEGNGTPFRSQKFNRNDPCRCGSGKKQKNCCGDETKFYYSKETPAPKAKTDDLKIKNALS